MGLVYHFFIVICFVDSTKSNCTIRANQNPVQMKANYQVNTREIFSWSTWKQLSKYKLHTLRKLLTVIRQVNSLYYALKEGIPVLYPDFEERQPIEQGFIKRGCWTSAIEEVFKTEDLEKKGMQLATFKYVVEKLNNVLRSKRSNRKKAREVKNDINKPKVFEKLPHEEQLIQLTLDAVSFYEATVKLYEDHSYMIPNEDFDHEHIWSSATKTVYDTHFPEGTIDYKSFEKALHRIKDQIMGKQLYPTKPKEVHLEKPIVVQQQNIGQLGLNF